LAPEVVLLYKASASQAKDEVDFAALRPMLDAAQRAWLAAALRLYQPAHSWLRRLKA
jgi:hypothetical protein